MDTTRTKPEIPAGLDAKGRKIYETLLQVRAQRITHKEAPPNVVVITDLAGDLDDLLAMVELDPLHDLGLIKIVGYIANLKPAQERARFGRGALDSLGRRDIPIAWGEEATTKSRPVHPHEFDCDFMAENVVFTPYGQPKSDPENSLEIESGISLLNRLVKSRVETPDGQPRDPEPEEKLTFLFISSLSDIWTFAKVQPENFVKVTSRIIFQGGYTVEPNLLNSSYTLIADPRANNNGGFDINSANGFHEFICSNKIPSVVYTKVAATASALPTKVLKDMAATGHVLGKHLHKVQVDLDLKYYEDSGDEKKRFRDHMDEKWFLETRTNWFESHAGDEPYPKGVEVLKYVLVVPYDPLAALEVAGPDVRDALNVLKPFDDQSIHKIVGKRAPDPKTNDLGDIGINITEMQMVLEALFKGSLMAFQERASSQSSSRPKNLQLSSAITF